MAVKREKPEPLVEDIVLCVTMGWTYQELMRQPAEFVERLKIYLNTEARKRELEMERMRNEIESARYGR